MSLPLFSSFFSALNVFTDSSFTAAYKPGHDSIVRAVQVPCFSPPLNIVLMVFDLVLCETALHFFDFCRKFDLTLKKHNDRLPISLQAAFLPMLCRGTHGQFRSNWPSSITLSALLLLGAAKLVFMQRFKVLCYNTWTTVLDSIWAVSPLPPSACALCPSAQCLLSLPEIFLERSFQGALWSWVAASSACQSLNLQVFERFSSIFRCASPRIRGLAAARDQAGMGPSTPWSLDCSGFPGQFSR
jgi:hypothetical protein